MKLTGLMARSPCIVLLVGYVLLPTRNSIAGTSGPFDSHIGMHVSAEALVEWPKVFEGQARILVTAAYTSEATLFRLEEGKSALFILRDRETGKFEYWASGETSSIMEAFTPRRYTLSAESLNIYGFLDFAYDCESGRRTDFTDGGEAKISPTRSSYSFSSTPTRTEDGGELAIVHTYEVEDGKVLHKSIDYFGTLSDGTTMTNEYYRVDCSSYHDRWDMLPIEFQCQLMGMSKVDKGKPVFTASVRVAELKEIENGEALVGQFSRGLTKLRPGEKEAPTADSRMPQQGSPLSMIGFVALLIGALSLVVAFLLKMFGGRTR